MAPAARRAPAVLRELPGGGSVLLDGAHNPAGAQVLAAHLAGLGEAVDLLLGAFADKDVAGMLPLLVQGARRAVLTAPSGPRGRPPGEVVEFLPPELPRQVEPDPGRSLERGLEGSSLVVVAGSLYLVGEVRRRLRETFGLPPAATIPLCG